MRTLWGCGMKGLTQCLERMRQTTDHSSAVKLVPLYTRLKCLVYLYLSMNAYLQSCQ